MNHHPFLYTQPKKQIQKMKARPKVREGSALKNTLTAARRND